MITEKVRVTVTIEHVSTGENRLDVFRTSATLKLSRDFDAGELQRGYQVAGALESNARSWISRGCPASHG